MAEVIVKTSTEDEITAQAVLEYETGLNYKQPRVKDWHKNEDLYYNKAKPALKGRFNVPLPIMSGFVETLLSKIDDPPKINFNPTEEADIKKAKKVTAAWEYESSASVNKWQSKDLDVKKLAALSGRGIFKIFAESSPNYQSHLEAVDYYDFIAEPKGGGDLENHRYVGQDSIFRSKYQLLEGVENGNYNQSQVYKLIAGT